MASKKDIQAWIDALRSGDYEQGKYALQKGTKYCCLGVACDVFVPKGKLVLDTNGNMLGAAPDHQPQSPQWLRDVDQDFADKARHSFILLNDIGVRVDSKSSTESLTFDEIADVLQAVYIEEVLEDLE